MIYWVWLSQIPFVGPVTVKRLLTELGSPEAIYCANMEQLHSISGISYKQRESIISHRSLELPEKILKECNKKEIGILCLDDPRYPDRAKIPEDAPAVLYFKGCFKEMEKTVGIVGARRCCQEAKRRAVSLAEEYSGNGYTVISGMAKGIDSYAHTACLNLGGFTVAVAGNGLDICYPSEHKKLMECIEERGLLISEYPPGTRPSRYSFPRRNRIISAWSDKIIAVAPGKGSGALSTIEFGKKYGREVEII
ncbi:MAG: DNA-processing protein DprA [Clostridia bacterium]|nr:DNA-processing protein DprA [Clostridia bacterium]MDY5555991.1 DNA-processing protein DprA [Blautia sp.]